nr:hypothetical protein [Acidithiobacillus thiooxidans]
MFWAEGLFLDFKRAAEERFGFRQLALGLEQASQVVEAGSGVRMFLAEDFFPDF